MVSTVPSTYKLIKISTSSRAEKQVLRSFPKLNTYKPSKKITTSMDSKLFESGQGTVTAQGRRYLYNICKFF